MKIPKKCGIELAPWRLNEHKLLTYAVEYDCEPIKLYQNCLQVKKKIVDLKGIQQSLRFGSSISAKKFSGDILVVVGDSMYCQATLFYVSDLDLMPPRHLVLPEPEASSFGLASYFSANKLVIKGVQGRKIHEFIYDLNGLLNKIRQPV